jgi:YaiO family outer membrane protein
MRFSFLLAMLLPVGAAAQAVPSAAVPTLVAAIELADQARNEEALVAFRQRAAADPTDHVARLWIARLHQRMGHSELAEPVYRSVLLEDPSNVDAMLGVASTLLNKREAAEAIEILDIAAQREQESAETFVLLGRAHRMAGRDARAIEFFERAVAIAPSDDAVSELDRARFAYMHRVEMYGFSERFSGTTPDGRSGDVTINYRASDRVRVHGRGAAQRKFGVSDQRGGGGFAWRWTPATTVRGQVLVGPDNRVMPEGDYAGAIDFTRGSATWSASMRHFDFTVARTTVVSPAVLWLLSERLFVDLSYAMSWTDANIGAGVEIGHSAQIGGDYRVQRRVWLRAGYAAGVENFETFSVDQIGDFRANAIFGGIRIPLPTLTTIVGTYERQWRRADVDMGRVTVALQQRF